METFSLLWETPKGRGPVKEATGAKMEVAQTKRARESFILDTFGYYWKANCELLQFTIMTYVNVMFFN